MFIILPYCNIQSMLFLLQYLIYGGVNMQNMSLGGSKDYTYLNFSTDSSISSTKGCLLKTFYNALYYKLSNYDFYLKTFGNESIYEVIAYRVGKLLGFNTLEYSICVGKIKIDDTILDSVFCCSKDFNPQKYRKVKLEDLYALEHNEGENLLEYLERINLIEYIYKIMIFDYIICNRDRHGANIEFLIENDKIIPTPIFDNGVSFMFSCKDDNALLKYDITSNPRANNYVGSQDLEYNLSLIKKPIKFTSINYGDAEFIFQDLSDCITTIHKNKIMDMLVWRCQHAKEILDF